MPRSRSKAGGQPHLPALAHVLTTPLRRCQRAGRWSRPRCRPALLAAALAVIGGCHSSPASISSDDMLVPGRALQGTLTGSATKAYRIAMRSGDAARVVLDQGEADFVCVISAPGVADQVIDRRDRGREAVTVIAPASGVITVRLRTITALPHPSSFVVSLETPPGPATARDHARVRAEQLESDGKMVAAERAGGARTKALAAVRNALAEWRIAADGEGIAGALTRIGDLSLLGADFEGAERAYLEALPHLSASDQAYERAALLNNLGVSRGRRGLLREAGQNFQEARELWRSLSRPDNEAATSVSEGSAAFEAGEYQSALEHFVAALPVFGGPADPRAAIVLNNIGVTYSALGDLDPAREYLTQSLSRLGTAAGVPRARTLVRLGLLDLQQNDVAAAEGRARTALEAIRGSGDRVAEAEALDLAGLASAGAGRHETALSQFTTATELFRAAGARRGEATALQHMARASTSLGRATVARELLGRALAIRHAVGLRDDEAETRYELGIWERDAGALGRADRHLAAALALIEDVRGHVAGEYSRTTYYAARRTYFSARIDVLMRRHELDPAAGHDLQAFAVAERERARALIDTLQASGARIADDADATLVARQRELQDQIAVWSLRVARSANVSSGSADGAPAIDTLNGLVTKLRETEARLLASSPRYAALAQPPILTARDVQRQLLDPQTVLVRYVLGARRSWAWVISSRSIRVVSLPPRQEIEPLARRVADLVSAPRTAGTAAALLAQFHEQSARLSAMIVRPVLAGVDRHRLLIVADGALQFLPLAALPAATDSLPLITRHEIVMLPSASALVMLRQQTGRRAPPTTAVAVFADPVYEAGDPRITRTTPGGPDAASPPVAVSPRSALALGRLPLSKVEGEAIIRLAQGRGTAAFGFAATRGAALDRLRDSRIVHFAAHAIVDSARPELSSIILSLYRSDGRAQDGMLRLANLHDPGGLLRADLVVLSACDTTVGKDGAGEGLLGLARGFLSAGAGAVIGSLYAVEEDSTQELMQALYAELLEHQATPAAALRTAQQRLLAQPRFQDPHYWAAFVITGRYDG